MAEDLERKHIISNTACHYPDSMQGCSQDYGKGGDTILAHKMRALLCGTQTTGLANKLQDLGLANKLQTVLTSYRTS